MIIMRFLFITILLFTFLDGNCQTDKDLSLKRVMNAAGTLEDSLGLSNYFFEKGINASQLSLPILHYTVIDWLGTPYRYGNATELSTDCSGFVTNILKLVYDKNIQRGSSRDLYKLCQPIKKNDLQEGDLVFFKISKGRISHVGLYLNNNKFVHAATKGGVIISDLNEPYYLRTYYGAGRLSQ